MLCCMRTDWTSILSWTLIRCVLMAGHRFAAKKGHVNDVQLLVDSNAKVDTMDV